MSRLFTSPVVGERFVLPSDSEVRGGFGSPEGVIAAPPGSIYLDATNGSLFIKSTGIGSTGWLPVGALGSTIVMWNGGFDILVGGSTAFFTLSDLGIDRNDAILVLPVNGIFTSLLVDVRTAPGGVETQTFTLEVNGAASVLTATIVGAATQATDIVNSVSVVLGDTVLLRVVSSAGAANTNVRASMIFTRT